MCSETLLTGSDAKKKRDQLCVYQVLDVKICGPLVCKSNDKTVASILKIFDQLRVYQVLNVKTCGPLVCNTNYSQDLGMQDSGFFARVLDNGSLRLVGLHQASINMKIETKVSQGI